MISKPNQLESTGHKALDINMDNSIYGSFAEIGAGQEVARWFFKVGGAAGTVAKTISAYDMKVSDDLYKKSNRYVSKERLISMLATEFNLITSHFAQHQISKRKYFSFANTVAARNYKGTNYCHGWIGIRFQSEFGGKPSDIVIHINMHDNANHLQAEAIGILGVNLIHGAYNLSDRPNELVLSLLDGLTL